MSFNLLNRLDVAYECDGQKDGRTGQVPLPTAHYLHALKAKHY